MHAKFSALSQQRAFSLESARPWQQLSILSLQEALRAPFTSGAKTVAALGTVEMPDSTAAGPIIRSILLSYVSYSSD